jgi:hypothetical protein
VPVKLGFGVFVRQAVEVGEHVDLLPLTPTLSPVGRGSLSVTQQIVDQYFGMNLFLNIQRRRMNDQVRPILLVLAAPNQLRIEITVAALVGYSDGALLILTHDRLVFSGRDVLARGFVVFEGFDAKFGYSLFCHVGLSVLERVFDSQPFDLLAVLQVFAIEGLAAGLKRSSNDQAIVKAEAIAGLNIQSGVIKV